MAPRRGPRQPVQPPQDSRMAAAIEAMAEMGFEAKLVRKKVTRLLKEDVYGVEGWRFIEESCYSVLLEALLEEQTNGDQNVGNASLEKSRDGNYAETATAGPSSSKVASRKKSSCGNNTETSRAGLLCKDLSAQTEGGCVNVTEALGTGPSIYAKLPRQTDARGKDAESSLAGPSSSKVASAEKDQSGGSEVETSEPVTSSLSKVLVPCSKLEAVNRAVQTKDDLDSASHKEARNNSLSTELPDANNFLLPTEVETQGQKGTPVSHSAQQVNTLPTRRPRPYHGWVGCAEDDFVILPEAPLPEVLRKIFILNVDSGKRKRKSMWDVQPENM